MPLDDSSELADGFLGAARGLRFPEQGPLTGGLRIEPLQRPARQIPPMCVSPSSEPTDDRARQTFSVKPNVRAYEPEFVDPAI